MFTSLINNELEHLFVNILDFHFFLISCLFMSFAHFLLGLLPLFLWIWIFTHIYIIYESLVGFIFFLVGFRHCKYLELSFLQTCQAHQPSGLLSGCPLCLLCSPRYLQAGLSGHLTLRWHIPEPKHSPLCHLILLSLWPYHYYPVNSLFTCLLFVSILAESLLVTV